MIGIDEKSDQFLIPQFLNSFAIHLFAEQALGFIWHFVE
jgi:hypothetical protein